MSSGLSFWRKRHFFHQGIHGTSENDSQLAVCAFLNRHGGTILPGVQDSGEVTPEVTPEVKKMLSIMAVKFRKNWN